MVGAGNSPLRSIYMELRGPFYGPLRTTMLKPEKMMNDIMFAVSMYFADVLKRRLLQDTEDIWPLMLIVATLSLWLRFEHYCARYKKKLLAPDDDTATLPLGMDVLFEIVYLISQTLVFLVVQTIVHVVDQSVSEQTLWLEGVMLPCIMILVCVLVVTFAKRLQPAPPADKDA